MIFCYCVFNNVYWFYGIIVAFVWMLRSYLAVVIIDVSYVLSFRWLKAALLFLQSKTMKFPRYMLQKSVHLSELQPSITPMEFESKSSMFLGLFFLSSKWNDLPNTLYSLHKHKSWKTSIKQMWLLVYSMHDSHCYFVCFVCVGLQQYFWFKMISLPSFSFSHLIID